MVAELHVAAVRALLANDVDEHLRLISDVDREGSVDAYGLFYKVTFAQAAYRRFGAEATRGDIIRFVAQFRAKQPSDVADLDILAAERLLLAMLGDQKAFRALSEEDSALIALLLPELASGLSPDALLAETQVLTERVERELAKPGAET